MANFEIALAKTLKHEGGYSNDPNDSGLETFCGISRRWWPNWIGWKRVDSYKENGQPVIVDGILRAWVAEFYRLNFWTSIHGDEIESQEIANCLFDFAVNSGISDAVKALQWAINKYSWPSGDSPNCLKVDGVWGDKTQEEFGYFQESDPSEYEQEVVAHLRTYRLHHILKNVGNGKIHPSFARGLAERAIENT